MSESVGQLTAIMPPHRNRSGFKFDLRQLSVSKSTPQLVTYLNVMCENLKNIDQGADALPEGLDPILDVLVQKRIVQHKVRSRSHEII